MIPVEAHAAPLAESMRERFGQVVDRLMDEDERVFLLLAAISTDLFRPTAERHPRRVVNAGIMEQTVMSAAAGLAMEGFHPFVHSIAPFIVHRPYEQIRDDFIYQGLGVNIVSIGASFDYAHDGYTHQAPDDVAALLSLGGAEVLVPGTAAELESLVSDTYANGRVTYTRTSIIRNAHDRPVRPGRLEVIRRQPSGAVVVAVGPCLDDVLAASAELDVSVAYCTSVAPFDHQTLRELAGADPTVVLVEPYFEGALVPAVVASFEGSVRIGCIGMPHALPSGYGEPVDHQRAAGLDAAGIRGRLEAFLGS